VRWSFFLCRGIAAAVRPRPANPAGGDGQMAFESFAGARSSAIFMGRHRESRQSADQRLNAAPGRQESARRAEFFGPSEHSRCTRISKLLAGGRVRGRCVSNANGDELAQRIRNQGPSRRPNMTALLPSEPLARYPQTKTLMPRLEGPRAKPGRAQSIPCRAQGFFYVRRMQFARARPLHHSTRSPQRRPGPANRAARIR